VKLRYLGIALLVIAGCGEDEDPPPVKQGTRANAAAGRQLTPAAVVEKLQVLRRVEDRAADKKERDTLRHQFRDTDFSFDPTGTMNRDPFRSYVVSQPGVSTVEGGGLTAEPTDLCPSKKQIAPGASARELKLIGLVSRGTTRWALLQEPGGNKGHIVKLGDCVGKEKARVTKMGASFVEAEIAAEQAASNQPQRPAEKIPYQLHPKQLPVLEDLEEADSERQPTRGRVTPGVAPPQPNGPTEL
jgi:Tfp pilus assembly protein PilP